MDYAIYRKMKENIEQEYKKKLDALELLWRDYRPQSRSNREQKFPFAAEKFSNILRSVVEGCPLEFTADDVEIGLRDILGEGRFTRLQITNALHRLYRKGEIEVSEKGRGQTPGRFKKKSHEKI